MSKQRVTLYLDGELWRAFRATCIKRRHSASALVEILIGEQMTAWTMDKSAANVAQSVADDEQPSGDTSHRPDQDAKKGQ